MEMLFKGGVFFFFVFFFSCFFFFFICIYLALAAILFSPVDFLSNFGKGP